MSFTLEVLNTSQLAGFVDLKYEVHSFLYDIKEWSINLMTHFMGKIYDSPPFLEYKKVCDLIGKRNAQEK